MGLYIYSFMLLALLALTSSDGSILLHLLVHHALSLLHLDLLARFLVVSLVLCLVFAHSTFVLVLSFLWLLLLFTIIFFPSRLHAHIVIFWIREALNLSSIFLFVLMLLSEFLDLLLRFFSILLLDVLDALLLLLLQLHQTERSLRGSLQHLLRCRLLLVVSLLLFLLLTVIFLLLFILLLLLLILFAWLVLMRRLKHIAGDLSVRFGDEGENLVKEVESIGDYARLIATGCCWQRHYLYLLFSEH